MKTSPASSFRSPVARAHYGSRKSSALLVVLGCMVFISVLIVAFFASVSSERQTAQFYANSSSVKMLSDSTLSIVMGQIVNATRGTDASGNTLSWASQPGMIRTYNQQGAAAGYYKLYSWTNMIGTGAFNPSSDQIPSSPSWTASPAIYTDLNDPVVNGSTTNYPIVNPLAATGLQVVGFSITGAPTSTTDTAPMPVRWLYVLQQGQVIAPDSGNSGGTVTFTQSAVKPSVTNPIVGRTAFWTDDDTCKVNINTAAGDVWVNASSTITPPTFGNPGNPGSFWDTPRLWDNFETNLASYQPANGEYQRYPGHPATVYLSAVFPNILTDPASIYALSPRVSVGGSVSGTTYPGASMLSSVDSDRLYASVDELLCATNTVGTAPTITRSANYASISTATPLTKTNIDQARFFLTAASRAPEVNLFNEPRVVVWPVCSTAGTGTYRTAYDNLIAYCGTLNNNLYYFQRGAPAASAGAKSPTSDLPTTPATTGLGRNRGLMTYLRNLTALSVPGFSTAGETFLSKYPMDRDQILTEIFDYIRSLNTQDLAVTNPYTPPVVLTPGEGQIFPITDPVHTDSNTTTLRGFGHMPIITEASLLFVGTGQTSADGSKSSVYPPATVPVPAPAAGKTRIQAALLLKFFDPSQGYAPYTPNFQVTVTGMSGMTWNGTSMGFKDPATITVTGSASFVATPSHGTGGEMGIAPCIYAPGVSPLFAAKYTSNFISANTLDVASGTQATPATFAVSDTTFTVTITDTLGNTLQTYNLEFPAGTFPVPGLAPVVTDASGNVADFRMLTLTQTGTSPSIIYGRFNTLQSSVCNTVICGTDVVRSIALTTDPRMIAPLVNVPLTYTGGPNNGLNIFGKVNGYDPITFAGPPVTTTYILQAHGINNMSNGNHRGFVGTQVGKLVNGATYSFGNSGGEPDFTNYTPVLSTAWGSGVQCQVSTGGLPSAAAIADANIFTLSGGYAVGTPGVFLPGSLTLPGDWDTGNGTDKDGAYINKADEGAIPYNKGTGTFMPYISAGYNTSSAGIAGDLWTIASGANFSPNRQMPSAGMFGSLPTGVFSNSPWQTLLFRPSPDGKILPSESPVPIGAQSPQDHLLLDLFNMPIVEPYAISDPFSTAGKINMNYQIVPFTYITRSTAVQAAMRSEQILAVPQVSPGSGNVAAGPPLYKAAGTFNDRYFLDLGQTLTGFSNMFSTGTTDGTGSTPDIFRSASQICNIWLVPAGVPNQSPALTYATMGAFWLNATNKGGLLTGDNVRERPYANLYQKLTTKSNTFTVHMRVQTLKMVKPADPTFASWVENTDLVTGEYRGSSTIERYLDTTSSNIPDYATIAQPPTAAQAIGNFYKFRVVETKQFTP